MSEHGGIMLGMQMTQTNKIIIGVVTVLILLGGYIYWDKKSKPETEPEASSATQVTATSTDGNIQLNTSGNGNYTIEQVPLSETVPVPDLNRPVHPASSATVTSEALVRATEKIIPLQAQLKQNHFYFDGWLDLAMYQKMAGDYQGAALSWNYASSIAPSDYITLLNLGNLYGYFLNDVSKAESYYKQAIARGSDQAHLYVQFAEFYRDIVKDKVKAKMIIDQGLSKMPNDPNLLQMKAILSSS